MNENDFAQLKALGEHRRAATPAIEVIVEEWEDRILLTAGGYELVIMRDSQDLRPIRFSGVTIRTLQNLLACHALLTRARQIIEGGA